MTLPDTFKVGLTKSIKSEEPEDIHSAYKRVGTEGMTKTWTKANKKKSDTKPDKEVKPQNRLFSKSSDEKNQLKTLRKLDRRKTS